MSDHWPQFLAAMAATGQPHSVFAAAEAITAREVGAKLFTATAVVNALGDVRRIYTNDAAAYPVSGTKPGAPGPWADHVMIGRQVFVANSIAAIATVFPDHEQIAGLGLGSVINLPVVVGDAVLGTINLLDVAGHYTPQRVAVAMTLQPIYALAFLAAFAAETHPLLTG